MYKGEIYRLDYTYFKQLWMTMNWSGPGPKLFFPNIVFTLIRSGIKRPSNVLTFRVPLHLTRPDIKAYLEGLYPPLRVESVQTTVFLGRQKAMANQRMPSKKNAVVTFDVTSMEGFRWPDAPKPEDFRYPVQDPQDRYPQVHKK